jgi:hypothetical protein
MFSLSRKWAILVLLVGVLKVLLSAIATVPEDFKNFIQLGEYDFAKLSHGTLPFNGVYTGMGLFLAPFYGLWLALPTDHSNMLILVLVMKTPIIVFDFLAGALIYYVIGAETKSSSCARKGFLLWYLNPYNIQLVLMWGSVDIVPAVFILLTVLLAYKRIWSLTGLSLAVASVLRLFPIILFPALLLHVLTQGRRAAASFTTSFLVPLAGAFTILIIVVGSAQAVISSLASLAVEQQFLILFGCPLSADTPFSYTLRLALLMFALQLYVMARFWKTLNTSFLSATLAFLLILFAATLQEIYRFNWVTPLLTLDYVISNRRSRMFMLLFVSAFLTWLTALLAPTLTKSTPTIERALLLFPVYNEALRTAAKLISSLSPMLIVSHPLIQGTFVGFLLCFFFSVNIRSIGRHATS